MRADEPADHWEGRALQWDTMESPLRPCPSDTTIMRWLVDDWSARQCILGATPEQLFVAKCDAVKWLRTRGVRFRSVSATTFAGDFTRALGRQRAIFMANPIGNAMRTTWRTASSGTERRGLLPDPSGIDA